MTLKGHDFSSHAKQSGAQAPSRCSLAGVPPVARSSNRTPRPSARITPEPRIQNKPRTPTAERQVHPTASSLNPTRSSINTIDPLPLPKVLSPGPFRESTFFARRPAPRFSHSRSRETANRPLLSNQT
jgi:hypothetical protein